MHCLLYLLYISVWTVPISRSIPVELFHSTTVPMHLFVLCMQLQSFPCPVNQNGLKTEQNRIERSNLHKWNKTKSVVNVVNSHTVLNAYSNKSSLTFNPLSVSYFLQAAAGRD